MATGGASVNTAPDPLEAAELYDPATGAWTSTTPMKAARSGHSATLLPNGKILVAGGYDSNYNPIAKAELYDPTTQTWTPTGSMHIPRYQHGVLSFSQ